MADRKHPDQARWDAKYGSPERTAAVEPAEFLKKNLSLLPKGVALDIAAGEGRNAVFLAESGFTVDAVDISPVGLAKAESLAAARGVTVHTIVANLEEFDFGKSHYDVIVNFSYLDRQLAPKIERALRPGGVLIFETFTVDQMDLPGGPKNPDYLIGHEELRQLFRGLDVLHDSKTRTDTRAVASLIARKT